MNIICYNNITSISQLCTFIFIDFQDKTVSQCYRMSCLCAHWLTDTRVFRIHHRPPDISLISSCQTLTNISVYRPLDVRKTRFLLLYEITRRILFLFFFSGWGLSLSFWRLFYCQVHVSSKCSREKPIYIQPRNRQNQWSSEEYLRFRVYFYGDLCLPTLRFLVFTKHTDYHRTRPENGNFDKFSFIGYNELYLFNNV